MGLWLEDEIKRIKKEDPLGWWWECRKLDISETWWRFRNWITGDKPHGPDDMEAT